MLIKSFKNPQILDPNVHKNLRIVLRTDMFAFANVDFVPIGYSELVACTMYYPVFFAFVDGDLTPLAVTGTGGKSVFLKEDGTWKVDVIPKALDLYPFGIVRKGEDYLVVLDMQYASESGVELFDQDAQPTQYMQDKLQELTNYAQDIVKAQEFAKEVLDLNLLEQMDLPIQNKYGSMEIRGMFLLKPEALVSLQPEKMYALNAKGYLFSIHAQYLSLRNFKLFDLI